MAKPNEEIVVTDGVETQRLAARVQDPVGTSERVIAIMRAQRNRTADQLRNILEKLAADDAALSLIEQAGQRVRQDLEQAELLTNLAAQYQRIVEVLGRYEMSLQGAPSWEAVQRGLTPEVLAKALKLQQPTLLLISPISREKKVAALNAHKIAPQTHDTDTYQLGNDQLWNSGQQETENKPWQLAIVEGVQDVAADPEIGPQKMKGHQMTQAWVRKYQAQGLSVLTGADAYLTLMMKSLQEGKPIDLHTYTVLNTPDLTEPSEFATGDFDENQVSLSSTRPDYANDQLRLRGLVTVDVQDP